jgi:hypothetical protein
MSMKTRVSTSEITNPLRLRMGSGQGVIFQQCKVDLR